MAYAAKLIICCGQEEVEQIPVSETVFIGCRKKGSPVGVQVDCPFASEMHGKLIKEECGYTYRDLGSEYGTYYNGGKIGSRYTDGNHHVKLSDGDVLKIDNPQFGTGDDRAAVIIFRSREEDKCEWKALELGDKDASFFLSCREETGGEEIQEEQPAEGGELPKRFALLNHDGHRWTVTEHNTKYGIYVNGQLIKERQGLNPLDVVRIGKTLFLYRSGRLEYNHHEASGNRLTIHIEERSVWKMLRRQLLLKDIDLTVEPGEMVLVLGGSGAGKTTFVNAVMGYEKAQGTIIKDGVDVYKNYNRMKYDIGFVPQQDWLRLEDSVIETLENAAEIKLPERVTAAERRGRVEEVLALMGLERERDSLVGKLSGGQRKRLSIAVEYIVDPSLFFLDEPDSGLDGIMARHLMMRLREIADNNKIILVITHSPDRIIDLFDKVIVLAKGKEDNVGHLAFYGSPREAEEFFETDSMEGIVRKMNREDEGGEGLSDIYIEKYRQIEER